MQALDEILDNITSKADRLIRKLNELSIENKNLRIENKELKQNILANSKVNLFSQNISEDKNATSIDQSKESKIRQELEQCISEVKTCLALMDDAAEV